ncbi:hypothetical protein F66182_1512 [Fusarium sp. NRRL 66182]|nr:hypothetical protein F66182_1512 [Fusarium sp. NRRL 66182]
MPSKRLNHRDYRVAWICPLEVEQVAAMEMLDEEHQSLPQPRMDTNIYNLGSINNHNVVIAGLPKVGNCATATVVTQMRTTFPNLEYGLLVGIGGGVPVKTDHGMIRLGHVVVGEPTGTHSGAIQYDHGKANDGRFERKGFLTPPPRVLLNAAREVAVQRQRTDYDPVWINASRLQTGSRKLGRFLSPGFENDFLYPPGYVHRQQGKPCAQGCDPRLRIRRPTDEDPYFVVVHRGTIASGELVIKSAKKRDDLAREHDVLCFEMEAAGALVDFPCIVIRGISDYCDSHKNDQWHGYASAVAAAYARELFFHIPAEEERQTQTSSSDEQRWLRCLYTTDYTFHRASIVKPVSGTCVWFLQHPMYKDWLSRSRSGLLWVSGHPGCGKSVLASFLIGELTAQQGRKSNTSVLYFFCDDKIQEHRNAPAILRGIIHQLAIVYPRLFSRHGAPELARRGEIAANELTTLWDIFLSMLRDPECGSLIIVVDALDECQETDRARFLGLITSLFTQISASLRGKWVKMLTTSRPEISIADALESLQEVRLKAEDEAESISQDVAVVTKKRLDDVLRRYNTPAHVLQKLTESLSRRAGQTFLWVDLVLQMIERNAEASEEALEEMVNELPTGLDGVYNKILARGEGRNRARTIGILQAIIAAYRPLSLWELNYITSVRAGDGPFTDLQGRLQPNMARTLQLLCGPLLKIVNSNVSLVHQTAKEFLLHSDSLGSASTGGWKHCLSSVDSHMGIGRSCVLALCGKLESLDPTIGSRAFQKYAQDFWIRHVSTCQKKLEPSLVEQVITLNEHYLSKDNYLRLPGAWSEVAISPQTRLAFAASCGFTTIVDALLDRGDQINHVDSTGMTAIGFSALSCHEDAVQLLLRRGADPSLGAKGAVKMALIGGDPNIVLGLLRAGAPWASIEGEHELAMAAEMGHEELLRYLSHCKIRMDQKLNSGGETAIIMAAKRGDSTMTRQLLDTVDTQDDLGRTALHWASDFGFKFLVDILANAGADLDARCSRNETPFLKAVKGGHVSIARFLFTRGADPNLSDNQDATPLWWASAKGLEHMVLFLLGVSNMTAQQGPPGSLAWWARANGHERVARLIEDKLSSPPNLLDKMEEESEYSIPDPRFHVGTSMVVPVMVRGREIKALVCTGAQVTIMSLPLAQGCKIDRLIDTRYSGVARGVGSAVIVGRVHVFEIQLGGVSFSTSVTVMESFEAQLLLGLDFLRRHRCTVDFHHSKLVFPIAKKSVEMFEVMTEKQRNDV